MKPVRIRKRWKILAAGIMALVCIGIAFNIWFIQNTNAIIESLVRSKSGGDIQLKLSRSKFHYFSKKLEVYDAVFYAAADTAATTTYEFRIPKLDLKLRSLWAFLVRRELWIDSINLRTPEVVVTQVAEPSGQKRTDVSIPEEVGRIYNSILDALQVLQVKRFRIEDGTFKLVSKVAPQQPVTKISNIQFQINNLKITTDTVGTNKFLYSDNMVLRVTNQDILLPDGTHRISFRNLLINVRNKAVQLDSCWVKAERITDRNAFRIFFDVLKMTNLDFEALYKRSEIRADSVYVNDPTIELALELKQKNERGKTLQLDTIIQQFTGNLALGYIGVENAAVNIVAHRGETATTFSSRNDNFQMLGLQINSDSAKPVYVNEFAMILRKYETYSRDSSALYRFDSLRFTNNKVRLSNFTIRSIAKSRDKDILYYSIPAFELTGLSWEDLLFDRYISAEKAVLLNPDIQYSIAATPRKKQKTSLFKVLSGLNETIDLREVEIRNGNLSIQLPAGKQLSLQQVNLVLASNKLLASTSYTGMQQAIRQLAFRNAVFTTANLRAELINLQYANRLYADELRVSNTSKTVQALARGITLNDIVWNNEEKSVFVDGLGWQRASVVVRADDVSLEPKQTNATIRLSHLAGSNTDLVVYAKNKIIRTTLDRFSLNSLEKKDAAPLMLSGLVADGKAAHLQAPAFSIQAGAYHLVDNGRSSVRNLSFVQQDATDTISLVIPQTAFNTQISTLLQGKPHFDALIATAPVLRVVSGSSTVHAAVQTSEAALPRLSIAEATIYNPVVEVVKRGFDTTMVSWSATGAITESNYWTFSNVHTMVPGALFTAGRSTLSGNKLRFSRGEKTFGIDSGRVQLLFTKMRLAGIDSLEWEADLEEALFQNPMPLALNKNSSVRVGEARVRNVHLTSANITNLYRLLQGNGAMQLDIRNGGFADEAHQMQWQHLQYHPGVQSLSIDSFSYQPVLTRDSFIAKAPGQKEYMHGRLKKLSIHGLDPAALEKEHVFAARSLVVDSAHINLYRDKQKPFIAGKVRPLPVLALQNLPVLLAVDTVMLSNATVQYTERSARTGQEGTIAVNRINAQLYPVRNTGLGATDSLTVRADGYLMDSALLRLRVKESYTDSLGTFAVTLRVSSTGLPMLNPVLVPLTSAKIASGRLDSITMRAIANDYFSIGAMQMHYHNLKVKFLNRGSETKKTFLTGLITFAANNFVIRKENARRTGAVYFLRNRDRGIFNFLVKTTLSGIASSVGAKRNKKYYRQYKRQQKQYNLPPVDLS